MISDLERQKDEATLQEVNQKDGGFALNILKLGQLLEIKRNYVDVLEANSDQYSAKEIADAKRDVEEDQKEYEAMILAQVDVQTTKSTLQKKIESEKVGTDEDGQTVLKLLVQEKARLKALKKQKRDMVKQAKESALKAAKAAKASGTKEAETELSSGTKPTSGTKEAPEPKKPTEADKEALANQAALALKIGLINQKITTSESY